MQTDWIKVEENPVSGVSTWIKVDGDQTYVQERQDIAKLLDENTALRNMASDNWKGDWHSIGRVPLTMLHQKDGDLNKAVQAGDDKWLSRFLNDGDNSKLRTKGGNV